MHKCAQIILLASVCFGDFVCNVAAQPAVQPILSSPLNNALDGRWSTGGCEKKYYDWKVEGTTITFRSEAGLADVEEILGSGPDFLYTVTVRSEGTRTGSRWAYRFLNKDTVSIQNLSGRNKFVQRRCGGPSSTNDVSAATHRLEAAQRPMTAIPSSPAVQPGSEPPTSSSFIEGCWVDARTKVCATGKTATTAQDEWRTSAQEFVESLFRPYLRGRMSELVDSKADPQAAYRIFEPTLAHSWAIYRRHTDDIADPFKEDPICYCLDAHVNIIRLEVTGDNSAPWTVVQSYFKVGAEVRHLRFELIRQNGRWLISNIDGYEVTIGGHKNLSFAIVAQIARISWN